MMTAEGPSQPSPYARAHGDLSALGWHAIPLTPADCGRDGRGKAPGEYKFGQWWEMSQWQRFRDRAPTDFERKLWAERWPGANVGVVLGARIGDAQVVALDIDAVDYDAYDAIARAAPDSPMVKRGQKGETRFYRASPSLRTRQWRDGEKRILADLLTGQETRQTVVPPSVHPETHQPYVWLAGPVSPADLPFLTDDDVAALVETMERLGATDGPPKREAAPREPAGERNFWTEVKDAAMADLAAWAPALGLHGLRRARQGYEAVATWRESSTGRPTSERKRNLSIQPSGIKDFGTGETFTPIDLVMRAHGVGQEEATAWLRERLGMADPDAAAFAAAIAAQPMRIKEPEPTRDEAPAKAAPLANGREAPSDVIRGAQVGILGALMDWVLGQSRRPQPIIALGAALSILGACTARRYGGPTRSGTHLYTLALAPSGAGKDGPLKSVAQALNIAQLKNRLGPGEFISFPAIINRLGRDPVCIAPIDEFGGFLKRVNGRGASSYEQGISGVMRQLWSSSFSDYLAPEWASRAAPVIHAPHFGVFGVATHQELYTALAGGDLVNGFLNRFLLLSTQSRGSDQDVADGSRALPDQLRDDLRAIAIDGSPFSATLHNGRSDDPPIVARWRDDEAKARWTAFAKRCELLEGIEAAFFARSAEMAIRLATLRSVGENWLEPRVSLAAVDWGIALATWSAETMMAETRDYMAETDFQAQCKTVLRLLRQHGEMSRTHMLKSLQHRLKGRELQDVLTSLIDADDVVVRQEKNPNGGPPRQLFTAV